MLKNAAPLRPGDHDDGDDGDHDDDDDDDNTSQGASKWEANDNLSS